MANAATPMVAVATAKTWLGTPSMTSGNWWEARHCMLRKSHGSHSRRMNSQQGQEEADGNVHRRQTRRTAPAAEQDGNINACCDIACIRCGHGSNVEQSQEVGTYPIHILPVIDNPRRHIAFHQHALCQTPHNDQARVEQQQQLHVRPCILAPIEVLVDEAALQLLKPGASRWGIVAVRQGPPAVQAHRGRLAALPALYGRWLGDACEIQRLIMTALQRLSEVLRSEQ